MANNKNIIDEDPRYKPFDPFQEDEDNKKSNKIKKAIKESFQEKNSFNKLKDWLTGK